MRIVKMTLWTVLILLTLIFIGTASMLVFRMEHPEMRTLDDVYSSDELKEHFGIGENKDPADYGFDNFELHRFPSLKDNTPLVAWYVPGTQNSSPHCILFVHGLTANRLRTMKYLEMIKKRQFHKLYDIFLPDLRRSGDSGVTSVSMGAGFADDIYSSIMHLHTGMDKKYFTIYAFSMGAMGTMRMLDNEAYRNEFRMRGIVIEKLIFDSPAVNALETLKHQAHSRTNLPMPLIYTGMAGYYIKTMGYAPQLRLSKLYAEETIPLLILQAKDDETTPWYILEKEKAALTNEHVQYCIFDTGGHVKLYQNEERRDEYERCVVSFLKGE